MTTATDQQPEDKPAPTVTVWCELGDCHRCKGTVRSLTATNGTACQCPTGCHDGDDLATERALEIAHFEEV